MVPDSASNEGDDPPLQLNAVESKAIVGMTAVLLGRGLCFWGASHAAWNRCFLERIAAVVRYTGPIDAYSTLCEELDASVPSMDPHAFIDLIAEDLRPRVAAAIITACAVDNG